NLIIGFSPMLLPVANCTLPRSAPAMYPAQSPSVSHVRFGSLADILTSSCNVRFTPNSVHSSTQVGCPNSLFGSVELPVPQKKFPVLPIGEFRHKSVGF